jgi:hypothetical protein
MSKGKVGSLLSRRSNAIHRSPEPGDCGRRVGPEFEERDRTTEAMEIIMANGKYAGILESQGEVKHRLFA